MRNLLLLLLVSLLTQVSYGQFKFNPVFPNLSGSELSSAVKDAYRPFTVLDYSTARDSMFRNVYGVNNSLSCVYTGHTVPMPLGQDPTEVVFMNGASGGINTEHTWPRSYGAENGNPKSDMHHLYPTRVDVNGARGTLPFLDIPDSQTDNWYYLNAQQGNIPSTNIDLYSERHAPAFEPREDHKGNVARAMMYFKTIYAQESLQAPGGFWENMIPTLCQWHGQDPVDELEWNRTWLIAGYQNDRPNPFVLDCTLAERLFCPNFSGTCDPSVAVKNPLDVDQLSIFPNPATDVIQINLERFLGEAKLNLSIVNSFGQVIEQRTIQQPTTEFQFYFSKSLSAGWYSLQIEGAEKLGVGRFIIQ